MTHWTDTQFAEADAAGVARLAAEPHATAAHYDPTTGLISVDLSNGCTFAFPARTVQGLEHASDAELATVAPLGAGFALEWSLDVQVTLAGLLAGVFGTARYMAELARKGGGMKSPAKAAAARANGERGGRPRRAAG